MLNAKKICFLSLLVVVLQPLKLGIAQSRDTVDKKQRLQLSAPLKPPFYESSGKNIHGILVDLVQCLVENTDYDLKMEIMPIKRIQQELRESKQHCSLGWFKSKERQQFASYTKPIWRDKQTFVLTRLARDKAIRSKHQSFRSLINDASLKMLKPEGVSYGPSVDQMIDEHPKQLIKVVGSFRQVVHMLAHARADYTLVHPPEWYFYDRLINQSDKIKTENKLSILPFADLIRPIDRHIICSKKGSSDIIQLFNTLIDQRLKACTKQISKENIWLQDLTYMD